MIEIDYQYKSTNFKTSLMNASGPCCTTFEELSGIGKSDAAGAIVIKSATIEPREGNVKPRYFESNHLSINSMGLPNPGYKELAAMVPNLKQYNKPIIASISGFSKSDYLEMMQEFDSKGADILELNLSCPNIIGKPQAGYNFEYSREVLEAARKLTNKPIAVKLPPYLDLVHQKQIADILIDTKIDFAVLINSVGNCLVIDPEKEEAVIKPKKGLGGLGGDFIKPIALGNVFSFYQLLNNKVKIIGCGGITTGTDVFEYILAGADMVQIATTYAKEGPNSFNRIANELKEIMQKKGYKSLDDFRGKLKEKSDESEEYNFNVK